MGMIAFLAGHGLGRVSRSRTPLRDLHQRFPFVQHVHQPSTGQCSLYVVPNNCLFAFGRYDSVQNPGVGAFKSIGGGGAQHFQNAMLIEDKQGEDMCEYKVAGRHFKTSVPVWRGSRRARCHPLFLRWAPQPQPEANAETRRDVVAYPTGIHRRREGRWDCGRILISDVRQGAWN